MKTLRLALAVVAAIGPIARAAEASVLCRTATRAVVERAACRARETPIALVDVGPAGPAGSPGPAGARGRGAASIVDAAGTMVGPVFYVRALGGGPGDAFAFALLEHEAVGGLAALGIARDGRGAGTVFYTDAACTGTAFVPSARFLVEAQVIQDSVFLPVTPASLTPVRSTESAEVSPACPSITPREGCCRPFQHTFQPGVLSVAERTTLEALGLRAPFSARGE